MLRFCAVWGENVFALSQQIQKYNRINLFNSDII